MASTLTAPDESTSSSNSEQAQLAEQKHADIRSLRTKAVTVTTVGVAGLVVYAGRFGSWQTFAEVLAAGILVSGGAGLAGVLLGFLFGIPRTTVAQVGNLRASSEDGAAPDAGPANANAATGYSVNTNLEQISDWLTKILVGVGLTQLNSLPGKLGELARWLGTGVPGHPEMGQFALGAIAYSSVFGFLFGYIWTRVVLSPMFRRADEQLFKAIARQAAAERSAVATIAHANARAQVVVQKAEERMEALETTLRKMLEPLYAQTANGFADAIRVAEDYLAKAGEPQSFMFWLRYAAAQGQRASRAKDDKNEAEFAAARSKALDAARKVLKYNADAGRYWLSVLWHPEHPDHVTGEDDLQVFYADADFTNLIGAQPYRMGERGPAAP